MEAEWSIDNVGAIGGVTNRVSNVVMYSWLDEREATARGLSECEYKMIAVIVRVWMVFELSVCGVMHFWKFEERMEVLSDVDDWILNLGMSKRKGGSGVNLYASTISERVRDVAYPW